MERSLSPKAVPAFCFLLSAFYCLLSPSYFNQSLAPFCLYPFITRLA